MFLLGALIGWADSASEGPDRHEIDIPSTRPQEGPTYYRDIAPIIHQHCTACHRPGQSAPFPLVTYGDVRQRADQIVDAIQSRLMPPWLPESGHFHFLGERRLGDRQLTLFAKWQERGFAAGNPDDAPVISSFASDWQLGAPDMVIRMNESYEMSAEGGDVYRNFVLPTKLERIRWVKAVEIRPGNYGAVHHILLLVPQITISGPCRVFLA